MAGIPLKSGADFYVLEAARMRLHNLGADPTEYGDGLIYFNNSDGNNTSRRARIYDGTTFRSLAFLDEIANNEAFNALQEKVALLAGDVDTDAIISNMKEVSAFLEGFAEDASLMDLLNSKLSTSGGIIAGNGGNLLGVNRKDGNPVIVFYYNSSTMGRIGFDTLGNPIAQIGGIYYNILTSAGGTIDGGNEFQPLIVNSNYSGNNEDVRIALSHGGEIKGLINWNSGKGFRLYNNISGGAIGVKDDGTPCYSNGAGIVHTLLHSGNYSDYALPLTGGTIRGDFSVLNFRPDIEYINSDEDSWGRIGFYSKGVAAIYDNITWRTILHEANYSDYALPLSGGTISDASNEPLSINNTTEGGGCYLDFLVKNEIKGFVGYSSQDMVFMQLVGGSFLAVKKDGVYYGSNTLLHSGNIGDVTTLFNSRKAIPTTSDLNDVTLIGSFSTQGAINQPSSYGNWYGGLLNFSFSDGVRWQLWSTNTYGQTALFFRKESSDSWSDWKIIAFTDSNVASAQALQNTYDYASLDNTLKVSNFGITTYGLRLYGKDLYLQDNNGYKFIINSSGNVTIGNQDYAGTGSTKLYVDGNLAVIGAMINKDASNNLISYFGDASAGIGEGSNGALIFTYGERNLYFYTNGTQRMLINSSGNVTIGASDLAETDAKLYVDGRVYSSRGYLLDGDYGVWSGRQYTGALAGSDIAYNATKHYFAGGNVLIGTTEDNGYKLDVNGKARFVNQACFDEAVEFKLASYSTMGEGSFLVRYYNGSLQFSSRNTDGSLRGYPMQIDWESGKALFNNEVQIKGAATLLSTLSVFSDTTINGNLHVKGNIIADGEVSAGGAGEEGETESTGNASAWAQTFTPTNTTMPFEHNRATTDVIVQVYEKNDGGSWDMILVDVEIISETKVNLHFGRTENREHKIVIMG